MVRIFCGGSLPNSSTAVLKPLREGGGVYGSGHVDVDVARHQRRDDLEQRSRLVARDTFQDTTTVQLPAVAEIGDEAVREPVA